MSTPSAGQPEPTGWRTRLPDAQVVLGGEGETVYGATGEGAWWLITDSGLLNELLSDPDDWMPDVSYRRFETEADYRFALAEMKGRGVRGPVGQLLDYALPVLAVRLEQRAVEHAWDRLTEARDLQPEAFALLTEMAGEEQRPLRARRERSVDFPEHWPKLGRVDIALLSDRAAPVFMELKGGQGRDALGDCAWDVLKLAVSLRLAAASNGYLLAVAPTADWERAIRGAEFFGYSEWTAQELRERYADYFRQYELKGYRPHRVPTAGATRPVASATFQVAGVEWSVRASQVTVEPECWLNWAPLRRS